MVGTFHDPQRTIDGAPVADALRRPTTAVYRLKFRVFWRKRHKIVMALRIARRGPRITSHSIGLPGVSVMRSVLALSILIALCVSANAAKVRHSKPHAAHLPRAQPVAVSKGYAVPGWTEEQTRNWLNSFHGGTD